MIRMERVTTREDWDDVIARSPVASVTSAGTTLRDALSRSVIAWVAKYNGKVACVWGVVPPTLLSEQAYLWSLHTELATEHKFLFVRHSQRAIEILLKTFPIIYGTTDRRNESSKRWLKWLGAEFSPGRRGMLNFVIRKKPNG